jgi:poly(hydroxyalkanoate) depolymerase family esterase
MRAPGIKAVARRRHRVARRLVARLAALLAVVATVVWQPGPQLAQAAPLALPPVGGGPTNLLGGGLSGLLGGGLTGLFGVDLSSLLGGNYADLFGDILGGKATNRISGSFTNSAGTRSYRGYVPSTYRAGTPVPLLVALHGCTQSADAIRSLTQLDKLAEADNFIVVYPEQPQSANYLHCWNWFIPTDMQRGSGEPSIIAGITQWVQQHYSIDPKRTFVTGFSAGGAMAAVMGATYPDLYAAIGVGSGLQYGGPSLDPIKAGEEAYRAMGPQARVVPTLIFHGGKDNTVPVLNADKLTRQWQTTADWADDGSANGSIPTAPASTRNEQVPNGRSYTVRTFDDGHGKEIAQQWLVSDMDHAWSGGCSCAQYSDPSGPSESKAMYDFFANHPMP